MRLSGSKRTWIGCGVWKPGDRGDVKRWALDTIRCWDVEVGSMMDVAIRLEVEEKWWEASIKPSLSPEVEDLAWLSCVCPFSEIPIPDAGNQYLGYPTVRWVNSHFPG